MPRESGSLLANINTLPGDYLPKPISRDRLLAIPAAIAAIGVVVAFVFVIQNTVSNTQATNEQVEANKFIISKEQSEKQKLLEDIDVLEKQIADLEIIDDSFTLAYDRISLLSDELNTDINAVVDNVVSGVEFGSIAHDLDAISIIGTSPTEEEILEYARKLDGTDRFVEIVIDEIRETCDTQIQNYNLTLKLKGTE